MSEKKKIIYPIIVGCAALLILVPHAFSGRGVFAFADINRTSGQWVHYNELEPTEEAKGIREYWVQCGGSYQFTKPDSDNIVDATSYDTSEFTPNDDRWIPNEIDCDAAYWYGKKWVALGTSITSTRDTNNDGVITGEYPNTLEALSGLVQTNYGVEGANLGGHPFLYSLMSNYRANFLAADLITVEGGINDWYSSKPLGTISDVMPYYNDWTKGGINLITGHSTGTFAGSCYSLFTNLKNLNPTATIVALTDCSGPDGGICEASRTNSRGLHLSDYNTMMKDVAEAVGIKFVDVGGECGIKGSDSQYFTDHVHLNAEGGAIYAEYIWNTLQTFTKKVHTDKEKVTVTFKTNDTTINTQTIEKGSSVYSPYPGIYQKRDFISWDKSLKNITQDTIINSNWTDNKVTISFDTDGGSVIEDIIDFAGAEIGEIPTPTKEGYIFDGWDKKVPSVMPNEDLVLTALWREPDNLFARLDESKNKMLVYDANGGTYEYARNGRNLSDYIATNNKKIIMEFDVDVVKNESQYSTANFNIIPFNDTEGNGPSYSIFYESYSGSSSYLTVSLTDKHYTITWLGYNYIRIGYNAANVHNISIKYATYTVSFSDGENIISEQTVIYGESAVEPAAPTKEGYIFDGWDTSFTNVKSNLLVTAKWKDEYELFDSSAVLNNTFLNSTANGTANGYCTSNYLPCEYNHMIRIDVLRKNNSLGDFRIALGATTNDTYLGTWIIGNLTFDANGVYNNTHIQIIREIDGYHTIFTVKNKNNYMHYSRLSYQKANITSISVRAV